MRSDRWTVVALSLGALVALPGCPALTNYDCRKTILRLAPAQCLPIANPCASRGEWGGDDVLSLPSNTVFSLVMDRVPYPDGPEGSVAVRRSLCAPDDGLPSGTQEMDLRYQQFPGSEVGHSALLITPTAALAVAVTATPGALKPGETAVLEAKASGGVPPYSYRWSEADSLIGDITAFAQATPTATMTYQVTVKDSVAQVRQATVTVTVVPLPCGNGVVEPPEVCDDGNNTDGDGCSADCSHLEEPTCRAAGAACQTGGDCCSGICFSGSGQCLPPLSCVADGGPCSMASDCCSNACSPTTHACVP